MRRQLEKDFEKLQIEHKEAALFTPPQLVQAAKI